MDPELLEELKAMADQWQAPDFKPKPLKNPENKGLVRSAFQKAIRRGQVHEALRMAEYLIDHNETEAFRALATVIVEDVGIGDLDLLAYSTVTTLQSYRNKIGPAKLMGAMVHRACIGPKSRVCCELSLGADKSPDAIEVWQSMKVMDEPALIEWVVFLKDPVKAYVAASVLRKLYRNRPAEDMMPMLAKMGDYLEDPEEQRAAMMSFERTVDDMNVAMFPILNVLNHVDEQLWVFDEKMSWLPTEQILSLNSEAFDMHTGIGARALAAFRTKMAQNYEWAKMILPDNSKRAMGCLVFIEEGGLLDKRIMSDKLAWFKSYQDINFARGYDVPSEITENPGSWMQVLKDVRDNIPLLNELRKWSASK